MEQLNRLFGFFKTVQRVLKMKDSVVLSLFSGVLGTLTMDVSNLIFWRTRKTEALYGHIAGSVYVRPFRTNQRKNFILGQIMHLITGATLAYPLNLLLIRTGKDHATLKGAFFGAVTWEFIYGLGRRFSIFATKPHMTKTHYAELFNNIIYGITTAQALVTFHKPSIVEGIQSKTTTQNTQINTVQPIYSDIKSNVESNVLM
ncbi:hypothetical protein [Desulfosporosinus sp. Sb-LF]|uniref:hypothetical protein n=1 Tax=Desulfosporosinus sp. Sb-LF TaxID=2560027 RepID=UPI0018EE4F7A|nr:hypothetical protein [Desulfosporosinus sp. Sb-LF]